MTQSIFSGFRGVGGHGQGYGTPQLGQFHLYFLYVLFFFKIRNFFFPHKKRVLNNKEFDWYLALFPGKEPQNPWDFLSDWTNVLIRGGLLGLLVHYRLSAWGFHWDLIMQPHTTWHIPKLQAFRRKASNHTSHCWYYQLRRSHFSVLRMVGPFLKSEFAFTNCKKAI